MKVNHDLNSELRTTKEAAQFLRISAATLERMRSSAGCGRGPAYFKLGESKQAKIYYRQADLIAWLDAHRRLGGCDE